MQINCIITRSSFKQIESTRWRKMTICKYHKLPYMPENKPSYNLEKIRGIKEVLNTSIAQHSLNMV